MVRMGSRVRRSGHNNSSASLVTLAAEGLLQKRSFLGASGDRLVASGVVDHRAPGGVELASHHLAMVAPTCSVRSQ